MRVCFVLAITLGGSMLSGGLAGAQSAPGQISGTVPASGGFALVVWGAWTDRRWVIPVSMFLAQPDIAFSTFGSRARCLVYGITRG